MVVCSITTLVVFALLAASSIPVLRAIGSTVALGVACNFVLALLITRQPVADADGDASPATRQVDDSEQSRPHDADARMVLSPAAESTP